MSKEIIGTGNPFVIEHVDRSYGGARTEVMRVDENTGAVAINTPLTLQGVELTGDQSVVGNLQTTGDITVGDDLVVTDDAAVGGDLAVTGASTFTGAVTLPANTVTAAQLATALAAQIPMTATLTVGALVGDGRAVTIQLKDEAGTNMALVCRVSVWLSAAAKGTPIGTSTTGLTTTITAGTLALTKLANLDFDVLSTALGALAVTVTDTNGTETRYVNVAVNGVVYASAAVVTT